jgi:hypothetical protein
MGEFDTSHGCSQSDGKGEEGLQDFAAHGSFRLLEFAGRPGLLAVRALTFPGCTASFVCLRVRVW